MCSITSSLYSHVIVLIPAVPPPLLLTPVDIAAKDDRKATKHYIGAKLTGAPTKANADNITNTNDSKTMNIQEIKGTNETIHVVLDMITYTPVPSNHILEELQKSLQADKANYTTKADNPNLLLVNIASISINTFMM